MSTSPSQIVREFLTAFLSGNIEKASGMMSDSFYFEAPLQGWRAGKQVYFAGAEKKATFIRDFKILRQWEDGDEVSTVYELDLGTTQEHAPIVISEWHKVRDGRLASAVMIFDARAKAVEIMRNALHA